MTEMPPDPFATGPNADLAPMAKSAFEMYTAFVTAGFQEDRAMQMTVAVVTTMINNATKGINK